MQDKQNKKEIVIVEVPEDLNEARTSSYEILFVVDTMDVDAVEKLVKGKGLGVMGSDAGVNVRLENLSKIKEIITDERIPLLTIENFKNRFSELLKKRYSEIERRRERILKMQKEEEERLKKMGIYRELR